MGRFGAHQAALVGGPALHFDSTHPIDDAASCLWQHTARYAADLLATDALSPLAIGNTSRLLAATALSVFPNCAVVDPAPADTTDATPANLRRAVAFIDAHPERDLDLAKIAAAAFVSPRALQYAFRRHMDTTPLAYLRRVRLDAAHRDLLAADPYTATVTEVAMRWGFVTPSRFTEHYRNMYNTLPSVTLFRRL
ncbi:helix-turn-helix transcriptional regulator [Streptomyces sp. NPDC046716]|uniref:helix-turn-helix transcriptional regulator n=1 Tax=Streptomyces sp. NPDC046716 TaxID=3157093 RepID=UPI0033CF8A00